jgi:hypothetical protein
MAAMKDFKVALSLNMSEGDQRSLGLDVNALNDIQAELFTLFMQVVTVPPAHGKFLPLVSWDLTASDISDTDLVVYFLSRQSDSLIRLEGVIPLEGDHGGLTSEINLSVGPEGTPTKTVVLSEVYVQGNFPAKKLAKIAFHELMHNKRRVFREMHKEDGLAVSPVAYCSMLSATNKARMSAALAKKVPQYTKKLRTGVPAIFLNKKTKPVAQEICV